MKKWLVKMFIKKFFKREFVLGLIKDNVNNMLSKSSDEAIQKITAYKAKINAGVINISRINDILDCVIDIIEDKKLTDDEVAMFTDKIANIFGKELTDETLEKLMNDILEKI